MTILFTNINLYLYCIFGDDLDILLIVDPASRHYDITTYILLFHNNSLEIIDCIGLLLIYKQSLQDNHCYWMLVITASMWSVLTTHSLLVNEF